MLGDDFADEYSSDFIGVYNCKFCGKVKITDASIITIVYPKGLEPPLVKMQCYICGNNIISWVRWEDAILFEQSGANVEGPPFIKAKPIEEQEITSFMGRFDEEVDRFLDVCRKTIK